jgi:hypothetical protein
MIFQISGRVNAVRAPGGGHESGHGIAGHSKRQRQSVTIEISSLLISIFTLQNAEDNCCFTSARWAPMSV